MAKRKLAEVNLNPKKRKFIDIIYSEFDSDPDSEDDPEWLPKNRDFISEESGTESEESFDSSSGMEECGTESLGTEECGTESEESNP